MKFKTFLAGCLGGLLSLNSCTNSPDMTDYAAYVNPFIGTGGHGHTFPGAIVPHGMISPSPDTRIDGWDACSGYYYADSTINGFSHTHLSGTGCCDYGDVLLMPTVGEQKYLPTGSQSQQMAYASAFSHQNETAEPGYYSVFLDTYQVKAELTASKRAAIHRYTFPESKEAGFILDLDYSLQRQTNKEMEIEVISPTEICGRKKTMYWAFDQYINFYAKFSKPFTYTLVTDSMALDDGGRLLPTCKALLHFDTTKDEQVFVKVGISAVDIEGARKNVETEIPDWDFDGVRKDARKAWNETLSKIDITTNDKNDKTIFYTALYHTAIVYGRRRTLSGYGSASTSRRYTESDVYHFFFMGYLPCTASANDHYRSGSEQCFHPFTDQKASGGGHFPNVGHGFQLYRYNDWLPCRSRHCRCIYERRS